MDGMALVNDCNADPRIVCHARPRRAHLVGIAGCGMRAMADVLLGWGWQLSGSDWRIESLPSLAASGVSLFAGHNAQNLPAETDLVIHSDAVPRNNPELLRAADLGIPTASYFQTIGRWTNFFPTSAIAGTHGKSSVTAMAAHILVEAGLDPTVIYGATPLGKTSGGRAGQSPQSPMLVEACEYRANFLHLRPQKAVILGIEPDHFDCYDTLEAVEEAFAKLAVLVPRDGLMLARHDCPSTRRATAGLQCRLETFGFACDADWSAAHLKSHLGRYHFAVLHHNEQVCEVQLEVPGRHNVLNALAAVALALHHGVEPERASHGLASFRGLERRLEASGTWRGIHRIDDYAHHPTEVHAALAAVREAYPQRRVVCVFQPHQVSRTTRLLDELAESLQNADKVLVADIFRAREGSYRPGEITAADLAARTKAGGVDVLPGHSPEEIVKTLETHLASNDVLVILGAGDVCHWFREGKMENLRCADGSLRADLKANTNKKEPT
jgi:UDP-N-acetylmuramate--alanine ligase